MSAVKALVGDDDAILTLALDFAMRLEFQVPRDLKRLGPLINQATAGRIAKRFENQAGEHGLSRARSGRDSGHSIRDDPRDD